MNILQFKKFIKGKRVAVIGIGVSNTPLIKMLVDFGAVVTARDKKTYEQLGDLADELSVLLEGLVLGDEYLDGLDEEIIFKTPGLRFDTPQLIDAAEKGSIITSEMEMFFELCPAQIIGVTGSDGKTTTTTLIYEMLKAQGYGCHLGGNIGKPLLSDIEDISPDDKVVIELSSFQLHTMKKSPEIAVVTNLSPNHLDVHKSMQEYIEAKENIFLHQDKNGKLIINSDNEITQGFAAKAKGTVITFGIENRAGVHVENGEIYFKDKPVLKINDILLPGLHNVENYMAAVATVSSMVDLSAIQSVAKDFKGVEHRIEFVREVEGVKYYNDSIASSPTRTMACINSFKQKLIIIAGGSDKYIPFDEIGRAHV